MKLKKILYLVIFFPLTCSTVWATKWQTFRYFQSKQRWRKIKQSLTQQPQNILNKDLSQSPNQLDFQYIKAQGNFYLKGQLKKEYVLIDRNQQGRRGFIILRFLKLKNDSYIIVNQGWIPRQIKNQIINKFKDQQLTVVGYLRKSQFAYPIKYNINNQQRTIINIQQIAEQKKKKLLNVYIERLTDQKSNELYPMRSSKEFIKMPYLTPDKHQSYALFWFSCTLIGLYCINKAFKI